jgi:hypothetical protein
MANLQGFNAHEVEPNESFDPIPAGDYLCIITASETKPTKSGNGSFLELEFAVIDGPHKGRKLWDRLNLRNPNETAVKIAKATLSAICRAVGVMQPKDSCELHDLPLVVKVRVERRADTDEPANVIKGYRKRDAGPPAAGAGPATAPVPRPSTPPWKRPAQAAPVPVGATENVPF